MLLGSCSTGKTKAPDTNTPTQKHIVNTEDDNDLFANIFKQSPLTLEIDSMPLGPQKIVILPAGNVEGPPEDKNSAVRVISGAWTVKKKNLILNLIHFNGYSCESDDPCHPYSYIQKILPALLKDDQLLFTGATIKP